MYDANDNNRLLGINLLGIRYRHDVCDLWLREKRDLKYAVEHLNAVNFDPEFFKKYEKEVVALYNRTFPKQAVRMKSKRSLMGMIFQH